MKQYLAPLAVSALLLTGCGVGAGRSCHTRGVYGRIESFEVTVK